MIRVQLDFEQFIRDKFPNQKTWLNKDEKGNYLNITVFGAWIGWREACRHYQISN